jgi:hypothetical protein
MLMPLLFISYDKYLQSSKSFQLSLTWIEKFGCQKPTKSGQFMFYEAVKIDLANSKESSFNNTISSTLSLITVLFEDLFEAVNIQAVLVGEKEDQKPTITSPNKTNTCDGYDSSIDIINNDEYNAVQNESLMMFEGFCIIGFWEFFNSLPAKSVPAGTKLTLFGRYVLNIYVGIVQYILRKMKTQRAKIYLPTQCTKWQI